MARKKVSNSSRIARRHRHYAAAAVVNCLTDSPDGDSCAREVVPLAAGAFSVLVDGEGTDGPIPAFPVGFVHTCAVQNFVCSVACVVYW